MTPNNDEVICPNCVHQFRAIPQNVQQLMLDAGFKPPFTTPPQRTWVGLDPEEQSEMWDKAEKRQAYQGVPALASLIQEVENKLKKKNT